MRKLLIASTALLTLVAAPLEALAQSRTGLPVMEQGIDSPQAARQFADAIDAAVAKDSSGNASIAGGAGGFYKPLHVWQFFARHHPDLGFTKTNPGAEDFARMTQYIRTLELTTIRESGRYYNTRVVRTGNSYRHDLDWQRDLPAGTRVWTDRNTGVAIFKANCANGLKRIVREDPCVYLVFRAENKDAFGRVAALGEVTPQEEAECPISYQGPGTGADGRTFDPNGYKPLVDCPDHPCDWRQATSFYRLPLHRQGSFRVSEGWWVIRLPRRFAETLDLRAILCLTDDNGQSTLMMGALPTLYLDVGGGMKVYTLYYNEASIPASFQALYRRENAESAHWRWPQPRVQYAGQ
jgi:hypothetical protein